MKKQETLEQWHHLTENKPILKHMTPIGYKASGSTYGACGIRIDGNPSFIDSVLSHLKELINGENHITRLTLARNKVTPKLTINGQTKSFSNTDIDAEVCYIRLHMRGSQGAMASAIFDRHLEGATKYMETCNI